MVMSGCLAILILLLLIILAIYGIIYIAGSIAITLFPVLIIIVCIIFALWMFGLIIKLLKNMFE